MSETIHQTVHMCVSIEGLLKYPNSKLAKFFQQIEGVDVRKGSQVRDWLRLQIAQGKHVLPMGECEGFDYVKGCPGHPVVLK